MAEQVRFESIEVKTLFWVIGPESWVGTKSMTSITWVNMSCENLAFSQLELNHHGAIGHPGSSFLQVQKSQDLHSTFKHSSEHVWAFPEISRRHQAVKESPVQELQTTYLPPLWTIEESVQVMGSQILLKFLMLMQWYPAWLALYPVWEFCSLGASLKKKDIFLPCLGEGPSHGNGSMWTWDC